MKKKLGGQTSSIKVLLTGGGTGGHVYPSLAIYNILKREFDIEDVVYVGSKGGAEEHLVPQSEIRLFCIRSAPLNGKGKKNFIYAFKEIAVGTLQALKVLLRFKPDLIIEAGGYVSAPITFASFILRPFLKMYLVLNEQNVVPGLMNKAASLFAHIVLVSFKETPFYIWNNRCVFTGYPVRAGFLKGLSPFEAKEKIGVSTEEFLVLIYGGSMGARSINRLVGENLSRFAFKKKKIHIVHSAGLSTSPYNAWEDTLRLLSENLSPNFSLKQEKGKVFVWGNNFKYELVPYIYNMEEFVKAADLIVCRAGAGTISEVAAAGKTAIVIPKRGLPGNHQEHNAIALAEHKGCKVVFERQNDDGIDYVESKEFFEIYHDLLNNPGELNKMSQKAKEWFYPGFSTKVIESIKALLSGEKIAFESAIEEPTSVKIQKQDDILVSFLKSEPDNSFYRRFYSIKMEEYLKSNQWIKVNAGIKLCGALRKIDKVEYLIDIFDSANGFMKRNILRALCDIDVYSAAYSSLVLKALKDPYFEVRTEAVRLIGKYYGYFLTNEDIIKELRNIVKKKWEHFEVKSQCIRVLLRFISLKEFFSLVNKYRFDRNIRIREAVLDGITSALEEGMIMAGQINEVRTFISEIPVTTSGFSPKFSIRQRYNELYKKLSENHVN